MFLTSVLCSAGVQVQASSEGVADLFERDWLRALVFNLLRLTDHLINFCLSSRTTTENCSTSALWLI